MNDLSPGKIIEPSACDVGERELDDVKEKDTQGGREGGEVGPWG